MFHCRVLYEDSVYAPLRGRQELEENVGIYLADNYEKITVPVPHFGGSDPADIIHDFHRVRTNIHVTYSSDILTPHSHVSRMCISSFSLKYNTYRCRSEPKCGL